MWTTDAREDLARLAEERRKLLDVPSSRVLRSRQTWLRVVNAQRIEERTFRQLEEALKLEPLSLDAFSQTRALVPRTEAPERQWDEVAHLTNAGELIAGIAGNTEEERAQVFALLEVGRQRLRRQREGRQQADNSQVNGR